jgi:uncharacterized RDD family membrane protein YckC
MSGWQIFVEVPGRPPVEVRTGESIVGRSRTAQVHVPDSTVSRQHARLITGGLGDVQVEDLGSSNGTYVNGERIEGRRRLADGDRILIGDAELRVRIVAPVATSEATVRLSLPPLGAPPVVPVASAAAAPPGPTPAAPVQVAPPPIPPMPPMPPVAAALPRVPSAPAAPPLPGPPPLEPLPPPGTPPPNVNATVLAPPAPRWTPSPASPTWSSADAPPSPAAVRPPAPRPSPPPAPRPAAAAARGEVLPSFEEIESHLPPRLSASPAVAPVTRPSPTLAGFGIRFLAWLVDAAVLGVASIGIYALAFTAVPLAVTGRSLLASVAVSAVGLFYPLVFWATRGATPGKMMLGLSIVGRSGAPGEGIGWGTAVLRLVGYVLSSAMLGIGFLLILFTSQKQGLHDLIAGTRVLRTR